MDLLLNVLQITSGILLIICILMQHRASGLSATFGGGGTNYVQRRGAEQFIYQATIWLSVFFFGLSVAHWFV